MGFERIGHEILTVEYVQTTTQTAVVRRHHTMYAHLTLGLVTAAVLGADVPVSINLVTWDTGETVIDMDRSVQIMIDGVQVDEVALVAGQTQVVLRFTDAGSYLVRVQGDLVQSAEVEVTVA